jgi:hypothetical protein
VLLDPTPFAEPGDPQVPQHTKIAVEVGGRIAAANAPNWSWSNAQRPQRELMHVRDRHPTHRSDPLEPPMPDVLSATKSGPSTRGDGTARRRPLKDDNNNVATAAGSDTTCPSITVVILLKMQPFCATA